MKEKSILEMVGGEKHINPHYNIKTEELKDEMKNRISLALKDPILQQGFEIICKENAELKARLKEHESIGNAQFWENVWSWKAKAEQLTEAKEIIKDLLNLPFASNEEVFADVGSHLDKAEQFLKDSEVEK